MAAGAAAGLLTTTGGLLVAGVGGFLYALGWTLSIYLSYLPLLIWLIQFVGWLIAAVVAAFGMPLWMLVHLSGAGDGIAGSRAQSGYGLLLALLLRPVLLVFGLYAAIALLYVLGGFVDQTLGTTLQNPPNSVFECIGLILMYVIAVIALAVNAPKYIAIFLTAIAGASWLAAGLALLIGVIKPDELTQGPLAAINNSSGPLFILLWAVFAIAGIVAQVQMTKQWEKDIVVAYSERRPGA
jgi:hypothetical protein